MSMDFDEPEVGGARLSPKDCLGHLLLVWAVDYIADSPTRYSVQGKASDVVVVDAVDLNLQDPNTQELGQLFRRCWWRNARLIQALKPKVGSGRPMLAVMSMGIATMGNAPFELASMTSDPNAVAAAKAWLDAHPDFAPSQPMPQPQVQVQAQPQQQAQLPPARPAPQAAQPRQQTVLERMAQQNLQGAWTPPVTQPVDPPF